MSRRLINMRLPEELLGRVDAEAECLGQTRTKFVERALEKALGGDSARTGEGVSRPSSPASPRAPEAVFACPKATCMFSSSEPGVCPHHRNLYLKPR